MPRKSRRTKIKFGRRNRSSRAHTPNTYVDPNFDAGTGEVSDSGEEELDPDAQARLTRRRQRADARLARGSRGRQAPMRAAVYSEFLPAELRKLGMVTAGLAVVLVILTFTIG
ncbi:MAG: hypothetical protein IH868_07835 [Chloroflexi bacterium]|nr:hypothetical protein [Chloroflexota bacterium]MCH8223304.1 hypothetical protein [Chloroflexota bacterium]